MFLKRNVATQNEATKSLQSFDNDVSTVAKSILAQVHSEADRIANVYAVAKADALQAILTRLRDYESGLFVDARAGIWRARTRLLRADNDDEPIADSDANLDPMAPGSTLLASLPAVVEWAIEFICKHSSAVPMGLDRATLDRRLRSFRTQMSTRKDGTGLLRLMYTARGIDMIARIDIRREAGAAAQEAKGAADRLMASVARNRR